MIFLSVLCVLWRWLALFCTVALLLLSCLLNLLGLALPCLRLLDNAFKMFKFNWSCGKPKEAAELKKLSSTWRGTLTRCYSHGTCLFQHTQCGTAQVLLAVTTTVLRVPVAVAAAAAASAAAAAAGATVLVTAVGAL